ncbi:MAG: hypothetical protein M3R24_11285 [Chloroflexota bacterium]|nr:hypothetical protein [Chloroflexota bacterium]
MSKRRIKAPLPPIFGLTMIGYASSAAAGAIWWTVDLGVVGTIFHLVGLGRRYRGYSPKALLFNWLKGPPVPAPLQLIGLGLAALIGERTRRHKG